MFAAGNSVEGFSVRLKALWFFSFCIVVSAYHRDIFVVLILTFWCRYVTIVAADGSMLRSFVDGRVWSCYRAMQGTSSVRWRWWWCCCCCYTLGSRDEWCVVYLLFCRHCACLALSWLRYHNNDHTGRTTFCFRCLGDT